MNQTSTFNKDEDATSPDMTVVDMPPLWLCAEGQQLYRETALDLIVAGIKLLAVDCHALAMLANAIVNVRKANQLLREQGMIVQGPRGAVMQHPAVRLADRYSREALLWAKQLGCTPESRSRWGITESAYEYARGPDGLVSKFQKRIDPLEKALCD
jgi:P27 family predicted phage terminase small subunit